MTTEPPVHDWAWPRYDSAGLGDVLPSVLSSLGVRPDPESVTSRLALPEMDRAVVVLVDGLGDRLLRRRAGHTPFLRSLLPTALTVGAGFPTTTATSMASFGTGLPPGAHGLVGYEVRVPGTGRMLNELSWEGGPVPEEWQPHTTVFEQAVAAGLVTTRIGPGFFEGSGLTRAALRGGGFVGAEDLSSRVDAAVACAATPRSLTYLYWGEVDKIGHVHGCESWQWGDEVAAVDAELDRLAHSLPSGTGLVITADHGMVDVPTENVLDAAFDPVLTAGVERIAGEPRSPQVYALPGAAADVCGRWRDRLGGRAQVLCRDEAVAAGLFGPVAERVLPRIGDVVVLMRAGHSVVDSRVHRPELIALRGVHGSLTADEVDIPILSLSVSSR
ncbi:MAG: alkaline phosphatase family protein [Intrasporangiaceae bacterium]|nr:alkaline phosphatase family protein [Intrasporangiaceae bacterium]